MEVIKRKACRAILFTPEKQVLLIQVHNPEGKWVGWITPGGGMDIGEDEVTALKRELVEELGLASFELGQKIWTRFHAFPWQGKRVEQQEVYYYIPIRLFTPKPQLNPHVFEMLDLKEFRWWSLEDIKRSKEVFAPRKLYQLLNDIDINGFPNEPINVGV